MDVTIQQEVPVVHQETLQPVSVTDIPESSHVPQPPPPPPPVTSIGKTTQVPAIEARCMASNCHWLARLLTSGCGPCISAVLSQMAHLVANITLNSASWGGSISPKGFLSSVLLWLVIIVEVVDVTIVVVIIVASSVQLLQENTDLVLSNQRMRPIAPSIPLKLIGWQLMNSFCASELLVSLSATSFLMLPESWLVASDVHILLGGFRSTL
ncbi:hypothetical protein Tco_0917177 [Tanacetum coccineum]